MNSSKFTQKLTALSFLEIGDSLIFMVLNLQKSKTFFNFVSFPKRAKRDLKEKCEGELNRNLGKKTDKLHAWDWYIFVFEGGRIEFGEKNGGCAKYGYICISNR